MMPELPLVTLYGEVPFPGAVIKLVPPIPAIEVEGVLVATHTYFAEVTKQGKFAMAVLPTNVGVETPWMYSIDAGGKSARIAIPLGVGAINFNALMAEQ